MIAKGRVFALTINAKRDVQNAVVLLCAFMVLQNFIVRNAKALVFVGIIESVDDVQSVTQAEHLRSVKLGQ